MAPRLGERTLALLFYLCCALLVLAPNLPGFAEDAIGAEESDAYKHVWGQWWVHRVITTEHHFPLALDIANFPDGGSFFCLDSANALVTLALRPLLGPVASYNLLVLLHLVLAAWCAFLLAREVTGGGLAALVAGVAFGFSPFVLSFAVGSGVSETLFLFPLPLIVLFALRTLTRPGLSSPVFCGVMLLLQGFSSWSYGIYGGLILAFLCLALGASRLTPAPGRGGLLAGAVVDRRLLGRALVLASVLALPALPLPALGSGESGDSGVRHDRQLSLFPTQPLVLTQREVPAGLPQYNGFAWVDYLLPLSPGLHTMNYLEKLTSSAYAGYTALLLWALGLVRRRRGHAMFTALALVFFVFSLGPLLYAGHQRLAPAPVNWVYVAFYYGFPLFNTILHNMDRFAVVFQLGLGVLAAAGLAPLLERAAPGRRPLLAGAAALLLLLEYLALSPAPWPIPSSPAEPHPASLALLRHPHEGAVLDVPSQPTGSQLFYGDIFLQQTIHGRPIPFNVGGVSLSVARNVFYRRLEALREGGPLDPVAPCSGLNNLSAMGFGHVIFRPGRLAPPGAREIKSLLDECLGPGRVVDGAAHYIIPKSMD